MDRRNFLRSLVGGIAATAAVRTFPFRVYSFPREIVLPSGGYLVPVEFARLLDPRLGILMKLKDSTGRMLWPIADGR